MNFFYLGFDWHAQSSLLFRMSAKMWVTLSKRGKPKKYALIQIAGAQ